MDEVVSLWIHRSPWFWMPPIKTILISYLPPVGWYHKLKLTNSMDLSTTWEDTSCEATQNFPAFYGTQRFITKLTRALHLVPILNQTNTAHTTESHLSKIRVNIIHPSPILIFLVVSFPLVFPPITYKCSSSPQFVLHAPPISSFSTWSF
jgi:hypothetical protein